MHSYGKDHIMWKAFSCFWKDMLCRKIKKNRFPINKLDWHFPCFGCMWLTRPQKYIALSDATFSKFLETVITYWATAPFPVWTEFIFLFSFFFFESNFCNWFVWLQSYSSKTVDSSLSPFFIFFCTFSEVKISPQPIVTASETFWSPNIWSFLYPHLIDINWFDQQMIWHLTKVTTLWLGCYSERSQTHCFCDFFTKNKSST